MLGNLLGSPKPTVGLLGNPPKNKEELEKYIKLLRDTGMDPGMAKGMFQVSPPVPPPMPVRRDDLHALRDVHTGKITPYAKLAMRMGWMDVNPGNLGVPATIDHIEVAKTAEGYVVFLVVKGKPLMVEDGELFPSDTLVTKLRMVGGE